MILGEHVRHEYYARAIIYWDAYVKSGSIRHYDNYYFWRIAYIEGKDEAIKRYLP